MNAADTELAKGNLRLTYDEATSTLNLTANGAELINDIRACATFNIADGAEQTIATGDVPPAVSLSPVTDVNFGTGEALVLTFSKDGAVMTQTLSMFDGLPYLIAQVKIAATNGSKVKSNHLVPFSAGAPSTPMGGTSNRILWVPFDNDGHLAYESFKISASKETESVSHEVGCVYNTESRFGIVAGAVDHDNWKNGVTIAGNYLHRITSFECLSGLSNYFTRDALPHGKVEGERVSSARFMVGAFDDWREGLYAFGYANNLVEPRLEWADGNPMGWSSYGSMQEKVNYDGVVDCARFIKDSLYDRGFHNAKGQTVISLDAFGEDNIPVNRLVNLSRNVFGNGTSYTFYGNKYEGTDMVLGLYGGPFCIWEWVMDSKVPGTGLNGERDYTFRDMALKVNGDYYKVPSNGAYASDPTHPAVERLIAQTFKNYNDRGAKYVKIDFMNCGIIQGDSYYRPEITTAVQAYNYAMKMVRDEAAKYDMYVVMAMSPAFPYQYTHGRRTCCDRFSQIGESEYVMNATSYGFWMDRLYSVCDPDQLVMCRNDQNMSETEGENRVRATTGMTTGAFIFGDNFSERVLNNDGTVRGFPEETRRRALSIMGNEAINAYVREHTGCFMPVEGNGEFTNPNTCEGVFVRHAHDGHYVAVFNFGSVLAKTGELKFDRLGIPANEAEAIKELWFDTDTELNSDGTGFRYNVPRKDVRVFHITSSAGIGTTKASATEAGRIDVTLREGECIVKSNLGIINASIYSIDGRLLAQARGSEADNELAIHQAGNRAIVIVKATLADGTTAVAKAAR